MSFWQSGSGDTITGEPDKAFIKLFTLVPDGTKAKAKIESFKLVETTNSMGPQKYYEVKWVLTSGDYSGSIVSQKIKPFVQEPKQVDRALNMMRLIMTLAGFSPKHSEAPANEDLLPMVGKIMGIKVQEWSMPKADGSMMEGNFVSEVHAAKDFVDEVGVKLEVVSSPIQRAVPSALTRNPATALEVDIPF